VLDGEKDARQSRVPRTLYSATGPQKLSDPLPLPPPEFDQLSVDEQIDYVQSLWDRIAAAPALVTVPEGHREAVDERLEDYKANPDAGASWDVVRERLRDKMRRR
jgi:putative addiction module component (TIGR02574 family)